MAAFYRIVQERWASTAMDGEGARLYGGRWNPTGLSAVYLAESRALAALEILVHAPREALRLEWRIIKVPDDWREQPTSIGAQRYGGDWLRRGEGVALRLPSVIIPQESSLLLNPGHINARELKISRPEVFSFDPRL
jgi:RES domain-containing protein